MPDLSQKLAAVREAIARATPGPWQEGGPWPSISVIYQTAAGCACGPDGGEPPEFDMVCSVWQGVDYTGRMLPEHPNRGRLLADAQAIVLAVNALPALLEVAEALATLRDEYAGVEDMLPCSTALRIQTVDAALARLSEVLP